MSPTLLTSPPQTLPGRLRSFFLYLLFLLVVLESALRFYQGFNPPPPYNLDFPEFDLGLLSPTLNHKPAPNEDYDSRGIQANRLRPSGFPEGIRPVRILFMGDSFIQGKPLQDTVPQYVWETLQKGPLRTTPLLVWNAGYSSYAPLIYIPQAKQLIPSLRPDLVVVDIDESDIVDDYALYRPLVTRDDRGKVEAVRPSPPYEFRVKGFAALRRIPLYVLRVPASWIHRARWFFMSRDYKQRTRAKYFKDPFSEKIPRYSFNLAPAFETAEEAEQKYAPELASFENDIDELMETLVQLTGNPEKILILYHPHVYQLTPDLRGRLWRALVPERAREAASRHGIDFYDATSDLKKIFLSRPEDFYRPGDMHFNAKGMKSYGDCVAEVLSKKIQTLS